MAQRSLALLLLLALPGEVAALQTRGSGLCQQVRLWGPAPDPLAFASSERPETPPTRYLDSKGRLCQSPAVDPGQLQDVDPIPSPGRAALMSALLPGLGQRYLGQGRWIAYMGIEAWSWIQFFDERQEGATLQGDYRDLAWSVARRVSSGARVDGDFEYYEALTKFTESGAWDANPQRSGIQPETDIETFNGRIWELAQDIFFPPDADDGVPEDSPTYRSALEYYQERSITPAFTWSWSGNELQKTVYADIISQSDENLRNSTTMVGVIIANHVVSAIDALISGRLRVQDPDAFSIHFVPLLDQRRDWAVVVRVAP